MRAFLFPVGMIAMLSLAACSVKEDRADCPCELRVLSEMPLLTEGSILVSVIQGGEVVRQGMMTRDEFERGEFSLMVPRGRSTVTFFSGITTMSTVAGHRLAIQKYRQCDEVYSFSSDVMLDADRCELVRRPHKNYANLFIRLVGEEGATVRVNGNVRGYELTDLEPSEGIFICEPGRTDDPGESVVRLPRQTNDSLLMELIDDAGKELLVPLGRMIASTGYPFEDEDLLDISLTIDMANAMLTISVADWDIVEFGIVEFK